MAERSVGAAKFAAMPGSDAEKAIWFDVTLPTISRWGNGTRKPTADSGLREKIAARPGGPLPCEWDEMPPEAARRALPPPPDASLLATPDTVQAQASRLLALVQSGLHEAAAEADVSRRMGILAHGATVMAQLGRVVGAGHVVTERQMLDSPHWRLLRDKIITALEPWPDALIAVAAAIES